MPGLYWSHCVVHFCWDWGSHPTALTWSECVLRRTGEWLRNRHLCMVDNSPPHWRDGQGGNGESPLYICESSTYLSVYVRVWRLNEMRNVQSSVYCVIGSWAFCHCSKAVICQVHGWESCSSAAKVQQYPHNVSVYDFVLGFFIAVLSIIQPVGHGLDTHGVPWKHSKKYA